MSLNRTLLIKVWKFTQIGIKYAILPFIESPKMLAPNKSQTMSVYRSQVKKLNKNTKDKNDVIKSEYELQNLGFVEFVSNLSKKQQDLLKNSQLQNYIPWRAVWNGNSISIPCRLVFDASQCTGTKNSLNSILAKGSNNMNRLVDIMIRWSIHRFGFHSDIQKMYNSVRLREEHWCFQMYLWHDRLDSLAHPQEKLIKTLIYGVKSSGNQAERALRETAAIMRDEYPNVYKVIKYDIYVDDCVSGKDNLGDLTSVTDELKLVLMKGGFTLKGVTVSRSKPPANLSSDGEFINVAGMKWFPESDLLALDTSELNFGRKERGKKSKELLDIIPEKFTRRQCVGKVAEVFDILGEVTPITAGIKTDLRTLIHHKLDWDDKIPNDLKPLWKTNFELIRDLSDIRFARTVIPIDAKDISIETLETADASDKLICAAIYARIERIDGTYSCQLVFSRSKLLPNDITVPRGELYAAWLNSATGFVVRRSFGPICKSYIKLSDSQVALHWINSIRQPLRQWVRNKVIDINRLSERPTWRYVGSKDMIADIGTIKGAKISDIDDKSDWVNGYPWMRLHASEFPVKTIEELVLDNLR